MWLPPPGTLPRCCRWLVAVVFVSFIFADAIPATANTAADRWQAVGVPLMREYCLDCHDEYTQEAGLDLSVLLPAGGFEQHPELVTQVVGMIRFGAMPPEDAALPELDERTALGDAMDELAYETTCSATPRPGRVTARRLNRTEYNHAIAEIFGVDLRPADAFPADDVGGGFDNNGDVLGLSPMLLEKYLDAADQVAAAVILDVDQLPNLDAEYADAALSVIGDRVKASFGGICVPRDGIYHFEVDVPVAGRYRFRVGGEPTDEDLEGEVLFGFYDAAGILRQRVPLKNKSGGGHGSHAFSLQLDAGPQRFFVVPSFDDPDKTADDDPDWTVDQTVSPAVASLEPSTIADSVLDPKTLLETSRRYDQEKFVFEVRKVNVSGPEERSRSDVPASQWRVLPEVRDYSTKNEEAYLNAAKNNLRPIMRLAFRRPIDADETQPYANIVLQSGRRGENFYVGMQQAIAAVLCSPSFLFRVELPGEPGQPLDEQEIAGGGTFDLDSYEIASRLAFFLWSGPPDDRRLLDAEAGRTLDPQDRRKIVEEMLADPRSDSLGWEFVSQWFGLKGLYQRDLPGSDLGLTAEVLESETRDFVMHLIRQNRPVTELVTADYTFAAPELADFYGLESPEDQARVSIADTPRRGILGHAGILTLTSYPDRNSPVLRGKWLLENLIGTPPPEPPAGVPTLEASAADTAGMSLRQQLQVHRADASCASCHRVMDAMGFGLEQFNHLGLARTADDPALADAYGELPGGHEFAGAKELGAVLAVTQCRAIADTAARRMMSFAIGRELRPADRCFIDQIVDSAAGDGYRMKDLLLGVINSPPFLTMSLLPSPTEKP